MSFLEKKTSVSNDDTPMKPKPFASLYDFTTPTIGMPSVGTRQTSVACCLPSLEVNANCTSRPLSSKKPGREMDSFSSAGKSCVPRNTSPCTCALSMKPKPRCRSKNLTTPA